MNYNNDGAKDIGAIAIGPNAEATAGSSVAIGFNAHSEGESGIVIGESSYNQAAAGTQHGMSTVIIGVENHVTGDAKEQSGSQNSIVGSNNAVKDSNGTSVIGMMNSVTDTYRAEALTADEMQKWGEDMLAGKPLGKYVRKMGSHVFVAGDGNEINKTLNSTVNGLQNKLDTAENVSVLGESNMISDTKTAVVLGDRRKLTGANNSIVLGSSDTGVEINVANATVLGHNAHVQNAGGVALGSGSLASTDKGIVGYDPEGGDHANDTNGVWKSTEAAVSVGSGDTGRAGRTRIMAAPPVTRQITHVAAGTEDTDAVNVAQIKALKNALNTTIASSGVHYYSVKSDKTEAGSNYVNDGAKAEDSLVAGINSTTEGVNSTVLGNNNKLTGVKNGKNNSIVAGQGLTVEGTHNAVFGTDYANYDHKETKVYGEANTVLGVGNLVGYTAAKDSADPTKWIYTKNSSGSDQNVVVGMQNTANGGSVVVGTSSVSDNLGISLGHGNTIIGMGNDGGQRGVAVGSDLTVKGEEAVAIGGNSEATADWTIAMGSKAKAEKETAMAFGYKSHAKVYHGVALGAWSVANTEAGVSGYDPSTKAASTETVNAWKSVLGAVSVGDKTNGYTRQITNVAAGAEDTDAVNVAQLKALGTKVGNTATEAGKHATVGAGDYVTVTEGTNDAGGKKYTVKGPALESTDSTVKITDKMENGKKVGYNLSVDTSKLGIKETEVKGGENVTVTPNTVGNKTTYTISAKDTTLKAGNDALSLSGKTLSLNIEDTSGKKVTGSVDLTAIAGQIDTNTTYTMEGKANTDNSTTISLKGSDGKENTVTVATKDTRSTVKAGENVTITDKDNQFGAKEYTINVKADGKVEKGNTAIVNGDTVYNETRVKTDGAYVKKGNSAGDNLSILDKQVGKNTADITNMGNTINEMNGRIGTLDNRISKAGAGAAALAALHPLDFDPHDKWDVAAGFGNYRNASAAAVGLFYHPNERTMMSLGWTMGDDRNMVNAGISVKLGKGDVYTRYSKVEMANRIESQNKEIEELKAKDAEREAQMKEILKQLDEMRKAK